MQAFVLCGKIKTNECLLFFFSASPVVCFACGADSPKKKCDGCRARYYCNEKCQSKHWKVIHRFLCEGAESKEDEEEEFQEVNDDEKEF